MRSFRDNRSGVGAGSFVLLILVFTSACSEQHENWSQADKENIRHFFTSAEANRAATAYSNDPSIPFVEDEYLKLQKLALKEAKMVNDAVMAKAHPELPERYRNLYQASLEQTILAFENRDNAASVKGSALHDQWVDWYNANRRKIRIPK